MREGTAFISLSYDTRRRLVW